MELFKADVFLKEFAELEDRPLDSLPDGMEKEDYQLMWQVLTAKKPSELEHVSNEQLIRMFYFVDNVADAISSQDAYFNCSDSDYGTFGFVSALKKLPSVSNSRRVL